MHRHGSEQARRFYKKIRSRKTPVLRLRRVLRLKPRLKLNSQTELNVPSGEGSESLTKASARNVAVKAVEVYVVEHIEEFGSKFQLSALLPNEPGNARFLGGGKVRVDVAGPHESIPSHISGGKPSRCREQARAENTRKELLLGKTAVCNAARDIRAIPEGPVSIIVAASAENCERCALLENGDITHLPAVDESADDSGPPA